MIRRKTASESYRFISCRPETKTVHVVTALRKAFRRQERKYHDSLRHLFAIALDLRYRYDDQKHWSRVVQSKFWNHRNERNRPTMDADEQEKSTFSALYFFAGHEETRYNRAYKYSRVLHHFYVNGVEPADVPTLIKEARGIEKLLIDVTAEDPRRPSEGNGEGGNDPGAETEGGIDARDSNEDGDADKLDDGLEDKGTNRKLPQTRQLRLGIDSTWEQFEEATDVDEGKRVEIIAIRENGAGAWKGLRILTVKPL